MGEVIRFQSSYHPYDKLSNGEQSPFLEIVKKSGEGRVLRNAMFTGSCYKAEKGRIEMYYVGGDVILQGRHLDELFEELSGCSMTRIYEFDPHNHREVSPWEPCIESITIRERLLDDEEKSHLMRHVRAEFAERYREERLSGGIH